MVIITVSLPRPQLLKEVLIPMDVVPDMVTYLCDHGFEEVVVTGTITGAMVSVAW